MADNNNWEKEKIMRDKFQKELEELNEEIIEMGKMIVYDIQNAVKALVTQDINLAKEAIQYDSSIDRQERNIEHLCLKLLLEQQPVAGDLRIISSALKMITDMERIGDHAADISEITIRYYFSHAYYENGGYEIEIAYTGE